MSQFEKLCNEYRKNKRLIEELEAMNDGLKTDILAIIGKEETYTEGTTKVTNKTVVSSRFNTTEFKKTHPDLFSEYSWDISYKRFRVL